jgi:hypothetical protein
MAERPVVLRTIRAAGALALSVAAVALLLGGVPATAASESLLTDNGTDPSAAASAVAWQVPGTPTGLIARENGAQQALPGADPALGPDNVVWREGETLVVADQATLVTRLRVAAPGAEEPAVSGRWLVWRAHDAGGDVLRVLDLTTPDLPPADIRRIAAPDRLGRPGVDGDRVVYHRALRRDNNTIEEIYLPTGRRTTLRTGHNGAQLLNPSELDNTLLYVSSSSERQRVRIGPRRARSGDRDRTLFSTFPVERRDAGHERGHERHAAGYPGGKPPKFPERAPEGVAETLWSTALAPHAAYVSRQRRTAQGVSNTILRLPR